MEMKIRWEMKCESWKVRVKAYTQAGSEMMKMVIQPALMMENWMVRVRVKAYTQAGPEMMKMESQTMK